MNRSMFAFDVYSLCLNAAIPRHTHVYIADPKLQEDDSFELGDIDDDIDKQFYVLL